MGVRLSYVCAAVLVGALPAVGSAHAAARRDAAPPRVIVDTAADSVLVGSPAPGALPPGEATAVRGRATDDLSGVRTVTLLFCPNGSTSGGTTCGSSPLPGTLVSTVATLACAPGRRSCAWTAPPPATPGRYLVFATAADASGRRSAPVEPVPVLVV